MQNDKNSVWSHPKRVGDKFDGMCHRYTLRLVDTRPPTSPANAVGELNTGGAWLNGQPNNYVKIITFARAGPPPTKLPAAQTYAATASAIVPFPGYATYDCRPTAAVTKRRWTAIPTQTGMLLVASVAMGRF